MILKLTYSYLGCGYNWYSLHLQCPNSIRSWAKKHSSHCPQCPPPKGRSSFFCPPFPIRRKTKERSSVQRCAWLPTHPWDIKSGLDCTGHVDRMPCRKWREAKQQPTRHQVKPSNQLLLSLPRYPWQHLAYGLCKEEIEARLQEWE